MRVLIISTIVISCLVLSGCESFKDKETAAELRWNKTSAEIKLKVARESFNNQRLDQAKKVVDECIKVAPEMGGAYLLAGEIELAKYNTTKAAEYFLNAIEHDSTLADAWFLLGYTAEQNSENEKAGKCYLEAHRLDKGNVKYILSVARAYISQGDYQQAKSFLEKNMRTGGNDTAMKITAANLCMKTGDYDDAIKYYRQAILLSNGDRTVMESLGYCYIAANRWEKAAGIFSKLSETSSDTNQYLDILAICEMNSGQYAKAASRFDKVSADNRDNAQFWVKLGQAHLGGNSGMAAYACANRALKLEPAMLDARNLKIASLYIMKDYRECINSAEKVIENFSNCSFAWMMAGRSYEKLGNIEKAQNAYNQSLKLEPDNQNLKKLANRL